MIPGRIINRCIGLVACFLPAKSALRYDFLELAPEINATTLWESQTIMSKRAPVDIGDGHDAYLKRQKLSHGLKTANTQEEIQSGRQLQQLLGFDQDLARGKHGAYSPVYFNSFRSS